MIRPTLQIGHPLLHSKNAPVTDFSSASVKSTIQDLIDSMHQNKLIGMAAPQIGDNVQIFITEPRQTETRPADQADDLRVFINPEIIATSSETSTIFEGCGSIANGTLFGPVIRPKEITVKAFDQQGKPFQFTADGILGRVIQHEYDHLHGIEFIQKIADYSKLISVEFYIQNIKFSPAQISASQITKKIINYL